MAYYFVPEVKPATPARPQHKYALDLPESPQVNVIHQALSSSPTTILPSAFSQSQQ